MTAWHQFSLSDQNVALLNNEVSVPELVEYYLERVAKFNPDLNALVHVDAEGARQRAEHVRLADADRSGLAGLPSADKDLVARAGMPTGYGSAITEGQPPAEFSDPMALWLDEVGAVSVGKTATSEFGMAAATESQAVGPTRNPHDLSRSAGGSSGGAAAAVAAGILPFAPGSDGGGSIRIPALSCGVVGWKPSRGLVPAGSGLESAGGLAVPGLITRTVVDLAYAAESLVRGSLYWATQAPGSSGGYTQAVERPERGLSIGMTTVSPWPSDWDIIPDPEALQAMERAREALVDAGHTVVECGWYPNPSYADDFVTLWTASAASLPVPEDAMGALEPLTRYLIERGRDVSGASLVAALTGLRHFEHSTIKTFSAFDAILTPGLNGPAPMLGWYDQGDAWTNFRQQVQVTPWTSFVNVAGLPAVSVPTLYSSAGMPLGAQLIGRPGSDACLMGLGQQISDRLSDATRPPRGYN